MAASEANPPDEAVSAGDHLHHCFVCREHAAFGFTTRRGTVWTCMGHREDGERKLQAQTMSPRSASGS